MKEKKKRGLSSIPMLDALTRRKVIQDKLIVDNMKLEEEESVIVDVPIKEDIKRKVKILQGFSKSSFNDISTSLKSSTKQSLAILDRHTDMELASDILVSAVTSPIDMVHTEVVYGSDSKMLPSDVSSEMLTYIKDEFNTVYKLKDNVYDYTYTAMITDGAFCELIIEEQQLESYISGMVDVTERTGKSLTKESFLDTVYTTESLSSNLEFTNFFNKPEIGALMFKGLTTESLKKKGDKAKAIDTLFKKTYEASIPSRVIEDGMFQEENMSRPLRMRVPMDTVIPIFTNRDTSNHIGYILLQEENGEVLRQSVKDMEQDYAEIQVQYNNDTRYANDIENEKSKNVSMAQTVELEKLSTALVESQIRGILDNDDKNVRISDDTINTIYKTMYVRTNKNLHTNIVYVPKKNMRYLAFKYNDNGTGQSILSQLSKLSADRSILRTAKKFAHIKNYIPERLYDVKLDNDDQDPVKSSDMIKELILRNNGTSIPTNTKMLGDEDLTTWANKLGISFNFKHDALPDVEINKDLQYWDFSEPNEDLEEKYASEMYMKFYLTPEMVQKGFDADYATTVVANNALFTKRILTKQGVLNAWLSSYVSDVSTMDGIIYRGLYNIVVKNFKSINSSFTEEGKQFMKDSKITKDEIVDHLLRDFLDGMHVNILAPEGESEEVLKSRYDDMVDFIDEYVDKVITEDVFPDSFLDEFDGDVDKLAAFTKNLYVRKWLEDNDYKPELTRLFKTGTNGYNDMDIFSEYNAYSKELLDAYKYFKEDNKEVFFKNENKPESTSTPETPTDDTPPDDTPPTGGEPKPEGDGYQEDDPTSTPDVPNMDDEMTGLSLPSEKIVQLTVEPSIEDKVMTGEDLYVISMENSLGNYHGLYRLDYIPPTTINSIVTSLLFKGYNFPSEDLERRKKQILLMEMLEDFQKNDKVTYNAFTTSVLKQYQANVIGDKLYGEKSKSMYPVIGKTFGDRIMNNLLTEEERNHTSEQGIYITLSTYDTLIDKVKTWLLDCEEYETVNQNGNYHFKHKDYTPIFDRNNVFSVTNDPYFIKDSYEELFYYVDLLETRSLLTNTRNKDISLEGKTLKIVLENGQVIDLTSKANDDGLYENPLFKVKKAMMKVIYDYSLTIEYNTSIQNDSSILTTSDFFGTSCVTNIIELGTIDKQLTIEDILSFISITNELNINLLLHLYVNRKYAIDLNIPTDVINELKALADCDSTMNYVKNVALKDTKLVEVKDSLTKEALPWNNMDNIVKGILDGSAYTNEDMVKNSPFFTVLSRNIEVTAKAMEDAKIEYIDSILSTVGKIHDTITGKTYYKKDVYKDGLLNVEMAKSINVKLTSSDINTSSYLKKYLNNPNEPNMVLNTERGYIDTFISKDDVNYKSYLKAIEMEREEEKRRIGEKLGLRLDLPNKLSNF